MIWNRIIFVIVGDKIKFKKNHKIRGSSTISDERKKIALVFIVNKRRLPTKS